jgi:hypothetical protein
MSFRTSPGIERLKVLGAATIKIAPLLSGGWKAKDDET